MPRAPGTPDRRPETGSVVRVLILGGTRDAWLLAQKLHKDRRFQVTTSLAGRTRHPAVPAGCLRIGGFGGAQGLEAFLRENAIDILINATHPFAAQISNNALVAAQAVQCKYYRLNRPPWAPTEDDIWIDVLDADHAAQKLKSGTVAFLTIGQRHLAAFAARPDVRMIVRMIEPPSETLPGHMTVVRERPPFSLAHERMIFAAHRVKVLVTKNAGGSATAAKLTVARDMALPVIMIRRPAMQPPADAVSVDEMLVMLYHGMV